MGRGSRINTLSAAGYSTAMWGKWHLAEEREHAPENQGHDYAYDGLWNRTPHHNWPRSYNMYKNVPSSYKAIFYDFPGEAEYKKRTGIDLSIAGYVGRKGKGRKPVEGAAGKPVPGVQEAFEAKSSKQRPTSKIKIRRRTTSRASSTGQPPPSSFSARRYPKRPSDRRRG